VLGSLWTKFSVFGFQFSVFSLHFPTMTESVSVLPLAAMSALAAMPVLSDAWRSLLFSILIAVAGYLILLFTNPAWPAFRDGFRCLQRHPRIWLWLVVLGLGYVAFQFLQDYQLGNLQLSVAGLIYWPPFKPSDLQTTASRAWLPSLELLAGLFNQAIATYPFSALAAFLFLVNWRGYQFQFARVARRRLGKWWLAVYFGLVLCALAALCKPLFSLSIYWLNQYLGAIALLRIGAVIDWLSFQFEYLFGLMIQILLVLSAFLWIRGSTFEPERVLETAVKRGVYVMKWAGIVLAVTALCIHLPLLISYLWIAQQTDFTNSVVSYIEQTARPLLAIGLLLFCSVQITLMLHNESLRGAVQEHAQFLRKSWYGLIWFLIVAGGHFFVASWLNEYISSAVPKDSMPDMLITSIFTLVKAFFIAWFLASWVCFYRRSRVSRSEIRF